jgi:tight adherence protein C
MSLYTINNNMDAIIATMAAVAAFCSFAVISWPYLVRDTLGARMREVAGEREAIRVRERRRLQEQKQSLRTEPKKIFKHIFDRLNLASQVNDSAMVRKLRMAGYRGQGPVVTFIAARVIMPALLFTFGTFYIFVVFPEYPFFPKLAVSLAVTLLGYYAPAMYLTNRIGKRQQAIRKAWPDALDLLLICVESGMGLEPALIKVSEEIGAQCPELAEEFALTTAELSYLPDRSQAFQNLSERTGLDEVKALVVSLGQSEKFGTALGRSLRVLAQESRDTRMMAAEKKAAALPPKLTVPMVLFFLPVLFAIIITPAVIQLSGARAQQPTQAQSR